MADSPAIELVRYQDAHQPRFDALNRVWLVQYQLLEPPDEEQLADPRRYFLAPGGEIVIAVRDGEVVGTAAVAPHGPDGAWEMAKLAVDPSARGHGVGRRLVERCIAFAAAHGARRVVLVSNHQLTAAIRIYEALGFVHKPLLESEYATADVYMELELGKRDT